MSVKPLTLYGHALGPNPWKVAIILDELNVPYETIHKDFSELKGSDFDAVYPNGRVPALDDPNTGLKLWESGAIIEYLLDTYDKENKLSYTDPKKKYDAKCWLHFQTSGQGPYYGQRAWFTFYHPEKVQSALDRYGNEIKRVLGVIDTVLKKNGTPYLIGDKATYADLAFIPWHFLLVGNGPKIMGDDFEQEWKTSFPHAWAWNEKLQARPAVTKSREAREKLIPK